MSTHEILISVGSNIQRSYHTRQAREALESAFSDIRCSSVYESEAVGFDGDAFYNLVIKAQTSLPLKAVCDVLKRIEADNGRVHGDKKFCSRTLDLDLLTYDDVVTSTPVVLPREEILYNAFVLLPLAELVPTHRHPAKQTTYQQLWDEFDKSRQHLRPVEFSWRAAP
ncbi:2-amino-4-hydroxy-6-hydroxymethyldihydropteridine diphosphokinase [Alteromonas halophila]|uniref:2-amino-4-hydroxy-6-hydroxymethyldihydropteridine diphosphokinase n=1 Tax=Alteromonas halophila TaxID=516698 RepID=A0A918JGN6_9ALTE|nr:2-amino-4-hydroxy-6-hydroxymethyldihydropteridine diphosphokinase [Alteromonas halophila]GGW80492.1 2-amino-4-hydroxy-6-hydroxymethyldihydropteridine diphosphokinase [Alteromonas halophila]